MSVEPTPRRLFLFDPEWRVAVKADSIKEYCYMMAPGQDFYHRLGAGEIYLGRDGERLCLACAERRGLLAFEPKLLREPVFRLEFEPVKPEANGDTAEWPM
jgi:hypothetical protein